MIKIKDILTPVTKNEKTFQKTKKNWKWFSKKL